MLPQQEPANCFPPTRWSLVVSSSASDVAALEEICRLYWRPLYGFCRRRGLDVEDAEDLTQRFFHDLIRGEAQLLARADPAAGRLRTLFLRILQRRIADHLRNATRSRRGGGAPVIPLDTAAAEIEAAACSADASPEQTYDRQWALNVIRIALARYEKAFEAAGRLHQFEVLVPFLGLGDAEPDYSVVRRALGLNDAACRQAVHRFRDHFRRHLRAEIAETIADCDETAIDMELEELRCALRR